MARRDKTRMLRRIVEVRAVQRQAAEQKVAEANQALARLDARQAAQRNALADHHRQWQAALGAPSLSLPLMQAWSFEVLKGEADLLQTAGEIERARDEKADRSRAWHIASALADAADAVAGRAETLDRRRLDEARLNEVSDRFAHRVAPW